MEEESTQLMRGNSADMMRCVLCSVLYVPHTCCLAPLHVLRPQCATPSGPLCVSCFVLLRNTTILFPNSRSLPSTTFSPSVGEGI